MSKTKTINQNHYQKQGYALHDKLVEFSKIANGDDFFLDYCIFNYQADLKSMEQFRNTSPKPTARSSIARANQLLEAHSEDLSPYQKLALVLYYDYYAQRFNSVGKELLVDEIEKLQQPIKTPSSSENKTLLTIMKSILASLEELQEIKQQLIKPVTKEVAKPVATEAQVKAAKKISLPGAGGALESTLPGTKFPQAAKMIGKFFSFFPNKKQPTIEEPPRKELRLSITLD